MAAGTLTIIPGAFVIHFVRHYIARGFALGLVQGRGANRGGAPRRGILGLDTTRGDRLFISLLGSAFIFLAWLAFFGTPMWGGFAISIAYGYAVFGWV